MPGKDVETPVKVAIAIHISRLKGSQPRMPRGSVRLIAEYHEVSESTVHRVARDVAEQFDEEEAPGVELAHNRAGYCGRPPAITAEVEIRIRSVPTVRRRSLEVWAELANVSKATLWRWCDHSAQECLCVMHQAPSAKLRFKRKVETAQI